MLARLFQAAGSAKDYSDACTVLSITRGGVVYDAGHLEQAELVAVPELQMAHT